MEWRVIAMANELTERAAKLEGRGRFGGRDREASVGISADHGLEFWTRHFSEKEVSSSHRPISDMGPASHPTTIMTQIGPPGLHPLPGPRLLETVVVVCLVNEGIFGLNWGPPTPDYRPTRRGF